MVQKKLIALAVASLLSGAACAQSSVTVWGYADMAYVHQGDSSASNVDSYNGLDDGGWDSSRFGFRGIEDLGNGLSAKFSAEFGYALDQGSAGVSTRVSNVSLVGKSWGEIKLGSFGSVQDDYAGYSESGGMGYGNEVVSLKVTENAYNAVEYISPIVGGGLQFKLGGSTNYRNEQDQSNDTNLRAWFGSAAYANGPVKLAFAFAQSDLQDSGSSSAEYLKSEYLAAGGYDFGVLKVGLGYDYATVDNYAAPGVEANRTAWRATIGAPISAKDAVALSYSQSETNADGGLPDIKATAWGVSYSHFLSKRTAFYASGYVADAPDGFLLDSTAQISVQDSYQNAVKFGIIHRF